MAAHKHYYLVYLQYLGFRFRGWAKQPKGKTIHGVIDKTLNYILGDTPFKTLGSSRTDARVSANQTAFEIFINVPLDTKKLIKDLNENLPQDLKVLDVKEVDRQFNIIQAPRVKEYHYLFTDTEKPHPFCASMLSYFHGSLDIDLMKEGAKVFEGLHNFKAYCTQPSEKAKFEREIITSEIIENTRYQANFFPEKSYLYKVCGKGFLRHQIRLMMIHLVALGRHEITLDTIKNHLAGNYEEPIDKIAPASGLILHKIYFD